MSQEILSLLKTGLLAGFLMTPIGEAIEETAIVFKHGQFALQCVHSETAVEELIAISNSKYGEVVVMVGRWNSGGHFVVLNNHHNPSWTMIISKPGEACFFASGDLLTIQGDSEAEGPRDHRNDVGT